MKRSKEWNAEWSEWEWYKKKPFSLYKSQPLIKQSINWEKFFRVVWQWNLSDHSIHTCFQVEPNMPYIYYNIIKLIELKRSLTRTFEKSEQSQWVSEWNDRMRVNERASERACANTSHISHHHDHNHHEMRFSIAVEWHSKFKPQIRETILSPLAWTRFKLYIQ